VQRAATALQRVFATTPPWELTLRSLNVFPHLHKPRVLWLGCEEDTAQLKNVRARLDAELRASGIVVDDARAQQQQHEQQQQAHLTLARWHDVYVQKNEGDRVLRVTRELLGSAATTRVAAWTVRDALLVHSTLSEAAAPEYTPLSRAHTLEPELGPRRRRVRV